MVKPAIEDNANFETESQFMRELREETFFENENKDAHDHVHRVLNIVSLFNIPGVSQDAVLLRVFPFTLMRIAKRTSPRQRMSSQQVIYEGPHLDKECPLNKEVKQAEEAKYREFGRPTPFNKSNEAKYHVGQLVYYTRTDNRLPYGEKRPSLKELMNKHLEESARRSTKMNEWIKNSKKVQRKPINKEGWTTKDLHRQFPPKELNPGNFMLPCTIGNFNFYGMADLGASVNVMPRNIFKYVKLGNLRNTNVFVEMADMTKKAPLGIIKEPLARSFYDYKWVFDLEIDQLSDEYEPGIGKIGICLIIYGNTIKMSIKITHTGGMIMGLNKRNALAVLETISKRNYVIEILDEFTKNGPYVFREIDDPENAGQKKMQEEEDLSAKELAQYEADIKLKKILMYGNMAHIGKETQKYYNKPTNNSLRTIVAPTILNKKQDYLPQNEVVRQGGIRLERVDMGKEVAIEDPKVLRITEHVQALTTNEHDFLVDYDNEGEQLEANVVFMSRLEKMKSFEVELMMQIL
uniref:Reverse transcriptase domain-containing protein n=1 Tax=Tanacetum cinerariifolium TaxID=118510 RepID=A0A6L2KJX0_TANCI|nr:hypothetical protein [Tanacetum cinerariifolium]